MMPWSPITIDKLWRSSNYVNKKGEHPKLFRIITEDRIALEKEELTDNNWLYIGEDTENMKNYFRGMSSRREYINIIEE